MRMVNKNDNGVKYAWTNLGSRKFKIVEAFRTLRAAIEVNALRYQSLLRAFQVLLCSASATKDRIWSLSIWLLDPFRRFTELKFYVHVVFCCCGLLSFPCWLDD